MFVLFEAFVLFDAFDALPATGVAAGVAAGVGAGFGSVALVALLALVSFTSTGVYKC